jgi:hypothetical protein
LTTRKVLSFRIVRSMAWLMAAGTVFGEIGRDGADPLLTTCGCVSSAEVPLRSMTTERSGWSISSRTLGDRLDA